MGGLRMLIVAPAIARLAAGCVITSFLKNSAAKKMTATSGKVSCQSSRRSGQYRAGARSVTSGYQ